MPFNRQPRMKDPHCTQPVVGNFTSITKFSQVYKSMNYSTRLQAILPWLLLRSPPTTTSIPTALKLLAALLERPPKTFSSRKRALRVLLPQLFLLRKEKRPLRRNLGQGLIPRKPRLYNPFHQVPARHKAALNQSIRLARTLLRILLMYMERTRFFRMPRP